MKSSYTRLMQSKYFSPAFNSAIFDGPVRLYFAQFHEAQAMKVYFMIQQKLENELIMAKEVARSSGGNVLINFYPTEEAFELSFGGAFAGDFGDEVGENRQILSSLDSIEDALFRVESWNEDVVIGIRGPIEDDKLDSLVMLLREVLNIWRPVVRQKHSAFSEM